MFQPPVHPGLLASCCFRVVLLSSLVLGLLPQRLPAETPQANPIPQFQPSQEATALCPAQLGAAIAAIADRSAFRRSRWGIVIATQTAGAEATLYARDPDHYFLPASNAKLLTTAAALTQLGPAYRLQTLMYGLGTAPDLELLRLVGRGDPSFSEAQLQQLARQLQQQGIRQVRHLIADESYFGGAAVNPTWEWEDAQAGYGAPVNSLILNQNALDLQLWPQALGQPLRPQWDDPVGTGEWQIENHSRTVAASEPEFVSVGRDFDQPRLRVFGQLRLGAAPEPVAIAVVRPAERLLQRLRQVLTAHQITVLQASVLSTPQPLTGQVRAAIASPPLAQLIAVTNQESNNLYAEVLLQTLGSRQLPPATPITREAGLQVLKTTLTQLGVDPEGYHLVDGSGLSRQNLVSPQALVQTLQAMAAAPQAGVYRRSLAIAGQTGTLADRFRNTPIQGILQAKTGTLTGVAALSGYMQPPKFPPLVFSILVNQSDQPQEVLRQAIDEMVLLLLRLQPCNSDGT